MDKEQLEIAEGCGIAIVPKNEFDRFGMDPSYYS
jgi:hypothetical protein